MGLFVYAELDYRIHFRFHRYGCASAYIIFICTYNLLSVWKQILFVLGAFDRR